MLWFMFSLCFLYFFIVYFLDLPFLCTGCCYNIYFPLSFSVFCHTSLAITGRPVVVMTRTIQCQLAVDLSYDNNFADICSHSFQIHENAVYPYKPHQSTAHICKGVLCPASCLFVPNRLPRHRNECDVCWAA